MKTILSPLCWNSHCGQGAPRAAFRRAHETFVDLRNSSRPQVAIHFQLPARLTVPELSIVIRPASPGFFSPFAFAPGAALSSEELAFGAVNLPSCSLNFLNFSSCWPAL